MLSHATAEDVATGRASAEDRAGNAAADRLATGAVRLEAPPPGLLREVAQARNMATRVQRMMIDIERYRWSLGWGDEQPVADSAVETVAILPSDPDSWVSYPPQFAAPRREPGGGYEGALREPQYVEQLLGWLRSLRWMLLAQVPP